MYGHRLLIGLTLALLILAAGALYQSIAATTAAVWCLREPGRAKEDHCEDILAAFNEHTGSDAPIVLAGLATVAALARVAFPFGPPGVRSGGGAPEEDGSPPGR